MEATSGRSSARFRGKTVALRIMCFCFLILLIFTPRILNEQADKTKTKTKTRRAFRTHDDRRSETMSCVSHGLEENYSQRREGSILVGEKKKKISIGHRIFQKAPAMGGEGKRRERGPAK